ncbi:pyridoxamine 5'-phosphate oxidase family protein [Ceratobasidium sp. AG-Ba]|nr:pyridoxamine 5'-phosphate oxidase family protein [Ceratobasidium sp. AG-Ba]
MGNFYDSIPEFLMAWIAEQHCFWVATAPLSADGHVNVSPKGLAGTFKLLGPNACFYQDLSGSGVETISHLRENGRITIMFSAFQGSPRIVRLFGKGTVHEIDTPRYAELIPPSERLAGSRAVIEVEIHKVGSSCGFSVPYYTWTGDRTLLVERMATREERDLQVCDEQVKNDEDPISHLKISAQNPLSASEAPEKSLRKYWAVKNVRSVDGIPGLEIGRRLAGLPPHERDAEKDNMRFHQPAGPKVETVGMQSQEWGPGWIVGAFVLGMCVTQLAGFVRHASRGV